MRPNYANRIVSFVDILGFRRIIENLGQDEEFRSRLHYALRRIKFLEKSKESSQHTILSDLEVSVFSDSIVISGDETSLPSLIITVGFLQADLLYLGLLTRGGIASGRTIHQEGLLYGEGLIRAYDLENKTAIFPRVIIAPNLEKQIKNSNLRNLLEVDVDHQVFINPFNFEATAPNAEELAAEGYDPRFCYFIEVRKHLIKMLEVASERHHLEKCKWIAKRFNITVSHFNRTSTQKCKVVEL